MSPKKDSVSCEEIQALALELGFPQPTIDPMLQAAALLPQDLPIAQLAQPHTAEAAWNQIIACIPSWKEDRGMAQLAVTMGAACLARQYDREHGISDSVFLETMKCLPRFLHETRQLLGDWIYDRGFWTWRQTGGLLFRLGALEFEYRTLEQEEPLTDSLKPGDPVLNVHIPSDAKLNREELDASYAWARRFFSQQTRGPWNENPVKAILCDTWLLSPTLSLLLPETSGIRIFSADYRLYHIQQDSNFFYRWLYQLPAPVPYEQLPERTSLQRSLKAHLLAGGHMGTAHGCLSI